MAKGRWVEPMDHRPLVQAEASELRGPSRGLAQQSEGQPQPLLAIGKA